MDEQKTPHQPHLGFPGEPTEWDLMDAEFMAIVRSVVENAGPKDVAARLGVTEPHLSNMTHERRSMRWAYVRVISRDFDPESRIATYSNHATNHAAPRRVPKFTEAEKGVAWGVVAKRHGLTDLMREVQDELEKHAEGA